MQETVPRKRYFENLDGLRFLLAVVVFFSHSLFGAALKEICDNDFLDRLIEVFTHGYYGVSFFFVLSGFLITYLMLEEQETTNYFSVPHFYTRRILRIWPVYYTALFFSFVIYPLVKVQLGYEDQNPYNIFYQAFFLANFDSIHIQQMGLVDVAPMIVGINWSVAIEEQFYLVWPLLFLAFRGKKFIIAIGVTFLASCIFRGAGVASVILYYHTLAVVADLALGAGFAYLAFYHEALVIGFFKRVPRVGIMLLYAAGILFMIYWDQLLPGVNMLGPTRVVNTLFFSFIILEQCYSPNSFYKFSNAKRISSFGKYTYAFYMFHPIGIQAVIIFFRYTHLNRESSFAMAMLYVLLALAASLILAMASYHLMEKRILSLRKKFY
jgi:peptidoglycan/LPS O-acetylase OafA/YrhL